ncbi:MAG: tRNA preQ1(34) S-adenosylmethionine ribosyltransferase-isomerase QueA [Leptospiraceae bacterium]|nr:tRNA preQ1(34) S-adenosylmethionine ribosyltransferase-isomerase QueA [Leptospiraceae bacterium]MCP5510991.1 tRNA preQ1(34) S-adenosylmethionine ribosyltransferase-isomerase QueA [Leptospiraceae bacterium]
MWNIQDFQFDLDESLIAKYPRQSRDQSRLMVLDRKEQSIRSEKMFLRILDYLKQGDTLVFNNTRVSKRRLYLLTKQKRFHEVIFLEPSQYPKPLSWYCLIRNSAKLHEGDSLFDTSGKYDFEFHRGESGKTYLTPGIAMEEEIFEKIGTIPIPPYLKRRAEALDEERYQTVFAEVPGSVASPTAALHFSPELLERLKSIGVGIAHLTLLVGYGTFAPLEESQIREKKLHPEEFNISEETAVLLNSAREKGRIISVGTTTLRALESSYDFKEKKFFPQRSKTDLFLGPGDTISSCDGLITNFHLPGSSLMFLVSAFAGKNFIMSAYERAIREKYRFFSYGDAMLIL